MDEEIETHLALRVADLVAAGMDPDDARTEAARRFGTAGLDQARRELRRGARRRAASGGHWLRLESIVSDLTVAWRQARRAPGFTAVTIITLALAIGVTTATFTLVRSVLLRPLPLREPGRLVTLAGMDSLHNTVSVVSSGNWLDWQRESRTIESTALHMEKRYAVRTDGPPRRVPTDLVSADFFRMLGTRFLAGRSFTMAEVQAHEPVAVVSESFWRHWLAAEPSLARPAEIEGTRYRIVGVVRAGDEFPAGNQVWIPLPFAPEHGAMRNNINWQGLARLRPGVHREQAQAELSTIALRIHALEPEALYSYGVVVAPLLDSVLGEAPRYLGLVMVAVLLVLLAACSNLAAMHLARGMARFKETAVRAALGATQSRLTQIVLVEQGLTAAVGGLAGVLLAYTAVGFVIRRWGEDIPRAEEVHIDWMVIVFAILASVLAGLLTGLAPARQASRPVLTGLTGAGGRGQVQGGRGLPGAPLLVAQVALAMVLLTGAGLLIRSLRILLGRDLGFRTNVITVDATLSADGYWKDPKRMVAYWDELIAGLSAVPGVQFVGAANWVPLVGMAGTGAVELEGQNPGCPEAGYRVVSEGYHQALDIPLVAGRWFGPGDLAAGERVVLANRQAAARCWPGENPLGKRIRARSFEDYYSGGTAPWLTVVGVVGDIRHWGPDIEPRPELYVLFRQIPQYAFGMTAVVRGRGPPDQLSSAVGRRAEQVDPRIAIELGTLEKALAGGLSQRRLVVTLLSGFGGFALVLTAVGLYGLLAFSVARRTRELAVRAALGAGRWRLIRTVIANSLGVVLIGTILGLAAAAGLTRFMTTLLVEVTPLDPVTLVAAGALILAVSLIAILIPAVRATRLDPAAALQSE